MAEIIETVVESSHNEVKSRMAKTAQSKMDYIKEYDKENRVAITIRLSKITEPELIDYWHSIPNKARWFKEHLRNELEESKKAGK